MAARVEALLVNLHVARYLARNPAELRRLPRWLQERSAPPMAIRRPWWPYTAVDWMSVHLSPGAHVFEYGGGGSTLWLEDHDAVVTVAEHDASWHQQLQQVLSARTKVLLRPSETTGTIRSAVHEGYFDSYVSAITHEPDESLDLVIVDGRARVACVRQALPKVKPGGLLLLDDTERLRYRPAVDLMAGWESHTFSGLKPGSPIPAQTSVWRKP